VLVKQHLSLGASLFFVFGLLLIGCTRSSNQNSASMDRNMLSNAERDKPVANRSALKAIPIGFNTLELVVEYNDENGIIN
jgi:hypothetical protein